MSAPLAAIVAGWRVSGPTSSPGSPGHDRDEALHRLGDDLGTTSPSAEDGDAYRLEPRLRVDVRLGALDGALRARGRRRGRGRAASRRTTPPPRSAESTATSLVRRELTLVASRAANRTACSSSADARGERRDDASAPSVFARPASAAAEQQRLVRLQLLDLLVLRLVERRRLLRPVGWIGSVDVHIATRRRRAAPRPP